MELHRVQRRKGKKKMDKIGSFLFSKLPMFMRAEIHVAEPEDKLLQRAILIEMIIMKVFRQN